MNERDFVAEPDKGSIRLATALEIIATDPEIPQPDKSLIRPVVQLAVRRGRLTPEQADKILEPIREEPSNTPIKMPYFRLMQQVDGEMVSRFFSPD